jgi:hypothetical protein
MSGGAASARVTQILRAGQAFLAERGSLPRSCDAWEAARKGDPRYPSWPTIRRAEFHYMEDLADALGTTTGGGHWGRTRVLDGLRLYVAERGPLPAATHVYHPTVVGNRRYPTFYAVLKYWPTFEAAAVAAGVPFTTHCVGWTQEEEDFLRMFAGTCPRQELAACLPRHSEAALKRRLYDLRTTCRTAQGWWTIERLSKGLGCTRETVRWLVNHKVLGERRVSMFRYLDPADLSDSLLPFVTAELRAAVLSQRRRRLAELIAGREVSLRGKRIGNVWFGPVEPTAIKLARLKRQRACPEDCEGSA